MIAARSRSILAIGMVLALAGCRHAASCTPAGTPAAGPPPPDWREAATDPDHLKLRAERDVFLQGLQQARAGGFGGAMAADPSLFDPDHAENDVALPSGAYACRTTTLGSKAAGRPALFAEPARRCLVTAAGALSRLEQIEGPQRPVGRLFPDQPGRAVFLGTVRLADERRALHYSRDADRDRAGVLERIGPARWRLVIPNPAWEATVAVTEITPVPR